MATDLNLTAQECDARGDQLSVDTYTVNLDLSQAAASVDTFTSTTTVVFESTGSATWLDLVADSVHEISLNGQPVGLEAYDGARVLLHDLVIGQNTVTISAQMRYSRTGEGLHRFRDPEDSSTYLYTHCEPTDARRVFACFEQPDLKGKFTFVITAPGEWVVRSNQPEVAAEDNADGTVTHTFAPTPPLSSYIVALIAGPYASVTDRWSTTRADGSTQTIDLTLMCRQGMLPYLESDEIFAITKAGLGFYDSAFGYPYPWGKYDQVFVPEYNIGAMENPGLVTFKESYLFRGGATTMQRTSRSEVILHEMAHMWFGDLVTPKWWDDLWLKESFADLMGYQVSQGQTRFDQAWLQFASNRKLWAYTNDQLPTTHPVIARIDDLEAARQNFDGITYAKGAAVLRQLQALIGNDAFFAGARDYFAEHAFGAARFNDLLSALAPHTEHDLMAWADQWLRTTTPSQLSARITRAEDDSITEIVVRQSCTDRITGETVIRPHELRVAGYALRDGLLERTFDTPVTLIDAEVVLPGVSGQHADLVLVNAGDLTYGVVELDQSSREVAVRHLSTIADDLDRAAVWTALWNGTRDGSTPPRTFVDTYCSQAPYERNAMVLHITTGQVKTAIGRFLPAGQRQAEWDEVACVARAALTTAAAGSDLQRTWGEVVAEFAAHSAEVEGVALALAGGDTPDGLELTDTLRWSLAASLVSRGVWGKDDIAAVLRSDDTLIGRTYAITANAASPSQQEATWQQLTTADLTNDEQRALLAGWALSDPGLQYADAYVRLLDTAWQGRSQSMAQRLLVGLFPAVDNDDAGRAALAAVQAWESDHLDAPAAMRRILAEQIDHAQRALRLQALG